MKNTQSQQQASETPLPETTPKSDPPRKKHTLQEWKPAIIVAVIALIIITLAVVMVNRNADKSTANSSTHIVVQPVQVYITPTGFEPTTMSIKRGTPVEWVNTDTKPHWVESDPFPEATGLPDLNSRQAFGPNESYTYTFSKTGDFTYHDQTDPLKSGIIHVE